MTDFFLDNYFSLTHFVEFLAAATGLFYIKKYYKSNVKYFIWFLVYIAIMEVFGSYALYIDKINVLGFLKNTKYRTSHWVATVFWTIGSTLFFSMYYAKILKTKTFVRIIKFNCALFIVASIINIVMNWNIFFNQFFPFITVFGAAVVVLCIFFYLIEVLLNEEVVMFYKSFNFVMSATFLIWLIITTPVTLYSVYYSTADWSFVFLRWQVFLFSNIFMYLTFTFALIYCNPKYD